MSVGEVPFVVHVLDDIKGFLEKGHAEVAYFLGPFHHVFLFSLVDNFFGIVRWNFNRKVYF